MISNCLTRVQKNLDLLEGSLTFLEIQDYEITLPSITVFLRIYQHFLLSLGIVNDGYGRQFLGMLEKMIKKECGFELQMIRK